MTATAFIVLAAGMGTRMKSDVPKVLHAAGGQSMIGHVLSAVSALSPSEVCLVVGPDMDAVGDAVATIVPAAKSVVQAERNGTAHAVLMAKEALTGFDGTVLVVYGDVPLIKPQTLEQLCAAITGDTALAVLGFDALDPFGYGRLVLDGSGNLKAIREELDATSEERKITLCNSGVIAVRSDILWPLLDQVDNDNAKGEYYLTDLIALGAAAGHRIAHTVCEESEVMGVNDRAQLAEVEAVLQTRYRQAAMHGGASLIAPETVFLSHDTRIGRDVIIEPHVVMLPGVTIGDGAHVRAFCHLEGADIGDNCAVGPYARLRPGTRLSAGAKVGNFVEIKNASLEEASKVNHLTYV
ncbi:MAG: NTP transferase domain-containing protein, partial [Aestuariivirgaceae bacterium]